MLADEDQFLHAVAILHVPVAHHARVLVQELCQLILRHRGIPLAGIAERYLFASLFEHVAGLLFVIEIADALGADHVLGPFAGHELVEASQVEGRAAVIDVGADAVFLHFAPFMVVVVMVMMVVVSVLLVVVIVIVVMMVVMLMLIMVFVFVFVFVMVIVFVIVIVFVVMMPLDFGYPSSRSGHLVEIEHVGINDLVQIHVAVVAVDDLSLGLQRADNLADAAQFMGLHVGGLIEQYDVAEFYLLDHEVLDVVLFQVLLQQVVSASEFVLQPQGIHHGHDAVEPRISLCRHLGSHLRNGADGLCDGCRFADAASLYHDIVEAVERDDVLQLLHEVHL